MTKTQLKKLRIEKFRALKNVEVEFGDRITIVCGKNGTSKSSILGIAAQIFSFEKNYVKDEELSFRQISGGSFKSQYSEHFRMPSCFDRICVLAKPEVHKKLQDRLPEKDLRVICR